MSGPLIWERDGQTWPNREFSRFISAGGLRWHVQVIGPQSRSSPDSGDDQVSRTGASKTQDTQTAPALLLLHGTGASTHSFRALARLMAARFTVVVPDLPGHGFTATPASGAGFSLPGVASGLAALLQALEVRPALVAGHSAGAAVAARMSLDGTIAPTALVSLAGALLPFPGMANDFFGPAARLLASSHLMARAFSFFAGSRPSVERLLRSTGSRIDAEGTRLYARLAASPDHVAGALGLMAHWDLRPLVRDLPRLAPRLILVSGGNDGMVPPSEAFRVRALVPQAELITLPGLGHLAHEERPDEIAALLLQAASQPCCVR
jgi:magnesium chelatase accessory protein